MIHLKSKLTEGQHPFFDRSFAVLVEPKDAVHNDLELYDAVRLNKKAVIRKFSGDNPPELSATTETLTAKAFEANWQGD